jgi:hypothetical protein
MLIKSCRCIVCVHALCVGDYEAWQIYGDCWSNLPSWCEVEPSIHALEADISDVFLACPMDATMVNSHIEVLLVCNATFHTIELKH